MAQEVDSESGSQWCVSELVARFAETVEMRTGVLRVVVPVLEAVILTALNHLLQLRPNNSESEPGLWLLVLGDDIGAASDGPGLSHFKFPGVMPLQKDTSSSVVATLLSRSKSAGDLTVTALFFRESCVQFLDSPADDATAAQTAVTALGPPPLLYHIAILTRFSSTYSYASASKRRRTTDSDVPTVVPIDLQLVDPATALYTAVMKVLVRLGA
jgi:hypothetical protein